MADDQTPGTRPLPTLAVDSPAAKISGLPSPRNPHPNSPMARQLNPTPAFSIDLFVEYLKKNSVGLKDKHGHCAKVVRLALEAGHLNTSGHPTDAKDYGPFLVMKGFAEVSPTPEVDYAPQTGDIMIFQPGDDTSPAGHIEGWCGSYWISDFKQTGGSGAWPNQDYKDDEATHKVYRWPK